MIITKTLSYTVDSSAGIRFIKTILNIPTCSIGDKFEVDIKLLKTSSHRRDKIVCKCDDCNKTFLKPLAAALNSDKHYCKSCVKKGERNPSFGKPLSASTKEKLSKRFSGKSNPMYGKTHSDEVKLKLSKNMIGNKRHYGYKNSKEQLKRMSDAVKRGYLDGSRIKTHGNATIGKYKNITYQGSYELDFLKLCNSFNILHKLSRGPAIPYIDSSGNSRIYLPDYYIKDLNLIVEIKSSHFLNLNIENNNCKFNTCKLYYNFILILDKDYSEFIEIIKNEII